MTIITNDYAKRLLAAGKAREEGLLKPDERGRQYVILTRLDCQRTDHYPATAADVTRIMGVPD